MHEKPGWMESPQVATPPRRKGGLETPLHARFFGENKRLTFAPPLWYDLLVLACIFGGATLTVLGVVRGGFQIGAAPFLGMFVGLAVLLAGCWGAASNERMACDLRKGTYARLEGQGWRKRLTRGSLLDLDALVLLAEPSLLSLGASRSVVYRLVLHWKGRAQPLLVVDVDRCGLPAGAPLNSGAGKLLAHGSRCAHALGVPFHDNSYFASPCPVPIAR